MKSSLPAATDAQSYRIEIIKREIGCIACRQLELPGVWADAHHLIDPNTGNRISHDHTIPLCKPHHDGPYSIHKKKIWFRETFGTDEYLLDETNALFREFKKNTIGGKHQLRSKS